MECGDESCDLEKPRQFSRESAQRHATVAASQFTLQPNEFAKCRGAEPLHAGEVKQQKSFMGEQRIELGAESSHVATVQKIGLTKAHDYATIGQLSDCQ